MLCEISLDSFSFSILFTGLPFPSLLVSLFCSVWKLFPLVPLQEGIFGLLILRVHRTQTASAPKTSPWNLYVHQLLEYGKLSDFQGFYFFLILVFNGKSEVYFLPCAFSYWIPISESPVTSVICPHLVIVWGLWW